MKTIPLWLWKLKVYDLLGKAGFKGDSSFRKKPSDQMNKLFNQNSLQRDNFQNFEE